MLGAGESLFKNEVALDFNFIPKLVPFREIQQKRIAACIKPLFNKMNGRNILIHGLPGVGKTVACRHVLQELEETTDEIVPIYVNCWQKDTSHKIIMEICDYIGYKFTQNKKTEQLFNIVKEKLNKNSVVLVFDEVDKLKEFDILYSLLEDVYRKTIILITNYKNWIDNLDERIRSRLTAEIMEFKPYNPAETKGILKQRKEYAFVPGVWEEDAFNAVTSKASKLLDIRAGLYLMRESGLAAEDASSRKINIEHVNKAFAKLDEYSIKKSTDLEDEKRFVLNIVKRFPESKIGDLHKKYLEEGGQRSYKSFQRMIASLAKAKFIKTEKVTGSEGNTTIVKYKKQEKKLTEF